MGRINSGPQTWQCLYPLTILQAFPFVCNFCTFAQTLSIKKNCLETGDIVQVIKHLPCNNELGFQNPCKNQVWWHALVTQCWEANWNLSREFKKKKKGSWRDGSALNSTSYSWRGSGCSSILCTHTVAHNHVKPLFQGTTPHQAHKQCT